MEPKLNLVANADYYIIVHVRDTVNKNNALDYPLLVKDKEKVWVKLYSNINLAEIDINAINKKLFTAVKVSSNWVLNYAKRTNSLNFLHKTHCGDFYYIGYENEDLLCSCGSILMWGENRPYLEFSEYTLYCPECAKYYGDTPYLDTYIERVTKNMTYDSKPDTLKHIKDVQNNIDKIVMELENRAGEHDQSKLQSPEVEYFDKLTPKLKELTYGSDEYKESLKELDIALQHHYDNNRHHPQYFENGIRGMTLVDIVEMFCDWHAACKRHDDGDIYKSIEINQKRFDYSDDLKQIFINTVKCLEQ